MSRRIIQLPCIFDAANRKKDRSLSLRLTTSQEITNDHFAEIDRSVGRDGWMLFSENAFSGVDVPTDDSPTDTKKPSARLRGALFIDWRENTDGSEEFDAFYRRNMEKLIDEVKARLP